MQELSHTGNFDTGPERERALSRRPSGNVPRGEREEGGSGRGSISVRISICEEQKRRRERGRLPDGRSLSFFAFAMPSRPSSDTAENHLIFLSDVSAE